MALVGLDFVRGSLVGEKNRVGLGSSQKNISLNFPVGKERKVLAQQEKGANNAHGTMGRNIFCRKQARLFFFLGSIMANKRLPDHKPEDYFQRQFLAKPGVGSAGVRLIILIWLLAS